jgi:hypothetical protein
MSGYYPDGVSGNEWQIAGGSEYDAERVVYCENEDCELFDEAQDLDCAISANKYTEFLIFTCPTCGTQGEAERDVEVEEDDPDRYRD